MIDDTPMIHPTAEVESGVVVGERTRIWRFSHVRTGARIGTDCTIGANVFVDAGVRIGSRVKVQNNVSVYHGVELADDVFVGPSAVFTNDLFPRSVSPDWQVTPTVVHTGAAVGANATIVCGNDIGAYGMVAAGAVVTHPVPDHALVAGNPARLHGWVCSCGAVVSRDSAPPDDFSCAECANAVEAVR